MLKEIIKRDGSVEEFIPAKINRWSIWASEQLGDRVDWSGIVMETMSYFKDRATSQELQKQLIKCCVQKKSWPYSLMAGRLYAALTRKELYGQIEPPTIKELHTRLQEAGMMIRLNYTDEQYEALNEFIDHKRDFEMSYTQLLQLRKKYGLRNHITKQEYESAQFVFMRMAMRLAMNEPEETKVAEAVNFYNNLSLGRINAPTPNYVNLGTPHNGFVSCCIYKVDDNIESLAVGDHIAYKMTAMSAGLGNHISTRALNDPVRNGLIAHQGKLPYFRAMAQATLANQQSGRGGSLTSYYSCYDPENYTIAQLQNPLSTEDKKIRQIHFGVMFNKFFAEKVAKNEDVFTFTEWSAPDLYQAMFKQDDTEFRELYQKYEDDDTFDKKYFNARDFAILCRQQAYETGTHYTLWIDEVNRHTPFKDPIYSSNLCVAGDTRILTDGGELLISSLQDKTVNVWNGQEYSEVVVRKTGEGKELLKVTVKNALTGALRSLNCTPEHRWYVEYEKAIHPLQTNELRAGDLLERWYNPETEVTQQDIVQSIEKVDGLHTTYCFTEEQRHRGVFNGILTGQCNEIMLPTKGYSDMMDLYHGGNHNGEVAICVLSAIVVSNIKDDTQYEQAAYYALKMVDDCIEMSDYPFEQIGYTARARRSAGVGIIGLATELARKGLRYDTQAGREYCHYLAERHFYWLVKASLRLAKERGNAEWINETKWPEGWLPIDTYNKNVDSVVEPNYKYDWEALRQEIIEQGGLRNSVLCAIPPTESSSKATGMPNAIYPIRDVAIKKTDNTNSIDWVATDSDLLGNLYQSAWEIDTVDMLKIYAIFQKFTDQGISADLWKDRVKDPEVYSDEIIREHLTMAKYGVKGHYYQNSLTSKQDYEHRFDFGETKVKVPTYNYQNTVTVKPKTEIVKNIDMANEVIEKAKTDTTHVDDSIFEYNEQSDRGCASGACTL